MWLSVPPETMPTARPWERAPEETQQGFDGLPPTANPRKRWDCAAKPCNMNIGAKEPRMAG